MILNKSGLTLGQLLAFLVADNKGKNSIAWQQLSVTEKELLNSIFQRIEQIKSNNKVADIFGNLPLHQCKTKTAYLHDNEDFFLALFSFDSSDNNKYISKHCFRLSKHLNDCYRCFEIFSNVMRDYYFKFQDLSQNS
jgi:hypothetical protein